MKNIRNILLSVGAAVASTKIIRAVSDIELDDVLAPIGLSRRRSHIATDLALLGAGAIVGGAVALIFAPMSGEETRRRISEKADELGDAASQKLRELGANVNPRLANSHSESHQRS